MTTTKSLPRAAHKVRPRRPASKAQSRKGHIARQGQSVCLKNFHLRSLLENLRLLVVELDCEGRVTYVNPLFLGLTGYSLDEVVGHEWAGEFVPVRDRSALSMALAEFLRGERGAPDPNSVLTKAGEERSIDWNYSLLREKSGRPAGVLTLGEDITERKRFEEASCESQDLLAEFIETVPAGIYMVDQKGEMTFANREVERVVGVTREHLKHRRYDDTGWKTTTVDGKPYPDEGQPYVVVMKTGKPVYGVEQSVERPDGTRVIISIDAAPLHDSAGKIVGEVGVLTDVTSRKAAEEALANERRLFNALMNCSPDSIYFKDASCRYTRVNYEQARVLGTANPADVLGKNDFDLLSPEDARQAQADDRQVIETGIPIVGKIEQVKRADGNARWVSATKAAIRDEQGRVIGAFGISRDIDEQKQLEDQLHHIKSYLETLIESANDIVYTLDADGHFTFTNRRAEEATGYTSGQWIGRHFLGMIAPEDRPMVIERVRSLALDQPQSLQFRLVSASEKLIEVSVNTTPIWEHGVFKGTLCIARDMTEQNRLERTIREERDRLDAILGSMAEAVLVTDSECRLILMNRAAEDLIGVPRGDLIGRIVDSVLLPITRADLDRHLQDGMRGTPHLTTRAWGARMLELIITTLCDTKGQLAGTVSLVRDVTEFRRVDQMKSEFISLVSHELRTPLTSVKGYTDLILAGDAGAINPEQNEFLGVVKSNVDHLIMMINDLLDISRIEAGRIKLLPAPIELTPLVGEVIRSLRPQLEAKSQIVSVDVPKSLPCAVADRDRLSQILANLISNAHKYSPIGTKIRIQVNQVEASRVMASSADLISRRAPMLAISVDDEGIGIEAEDQEKLFTKYYRVDNSFTREISGTGLGLAIVKSFVEMHGGRVWVSSPTDSLTRRGSCFTFTIPGVELAETRSFD